MMHLALPWLLALLPLPLIMMLLPAKEQTQNNALRVPLIMQQASTSSMSQPTKKSRRFILLYFIWSLIVLAVSQPQWLGEAVPIPSEGREMMIAVDLSGSMQMEDMVINNRAVNRLDMIKLVLGEFIERREGDKLGLILFADDAYMQTPMTFDRNNVKQMLDESELGLVGQATAIGDAIGLAVKRFDEKDSSNRILLLLTDGQNTAGKLSPDEALSLAVENNVTIYTIGIGADEILQRSFFGGTRRVNPSADLDEDTLTNIATATNGRYFRARDTKAMAEIYQLLDELEPIEQEQKQVRPLTALFYWPLSIALLTALMYLLYTSRHLFHFSSQLRK